MRASSAFIVSALLLLFACNRQGSVPQRQPPETENCTLVFWEDGDTAVVDCPSNHRTTVRLVGIDTPESGFDENSRKRGMRQVKWWGIRLEQVFVCGKHATRRARELCPRGSKVVVRGNEFGKYGRRLAEIVCRGVNINERLVEEGLAGRYPYPKPPERPRACGAGS